MKTSLRTLFSIKPKTSFNSYIETYLSLLKNVTAQNLVTRGSALHGHLLKIGVSKERYIAVKLLIMYLNSRKSVEANEIMKEFNGFDLVAHNCMINAYIQWGNLDEARRLFDEMPERNEVSWTALVSGFMKHGLIEESMWCFERNPFQNVVSWTAAISGFVQNGFSFEALKLFLKLLESGVKPNEVTFTSIIRACAGFGDFRLGKSVIGLIVKVGFEESVSVSNSLITLCLRMGKVHLVNRLFDRMEKRDVVSWTAILDLYVEMGDLREARRIFNEMPERNEVSWSAMIARYSQSGYPEEALRLFRQMVQCSFKPNTPCFSTIISALASFEALRPGMNIHAHIVKIGIEKDVFISSALIDLYSKCGKTKDGCLVFDSIEEKNVVSWNSMIGGYSLNGQMEEAKDLFDNMPKRNDVSWSAIISGYLEHKQFDMVFEVFNEMLLLGEIPNKSTFSSVLCASACTASLEKGKYLHGKLIKLGFPYDVFVGTALTDMYAKSGDIESSKQVFDRMLEKNDISWTVMIQGLAENGYAEESLILFEEMEKTSVTPNEVMLLSVLFACSHSGLVDKGLKYFNSMETVYHIKPKGRHYTCLVDMLSRSGRLSEAEDCINSMPFQPEYNAWAALLSGCKTYKNEEIAERAAKKLWELAEKNSAGYVLLSNIYASAGRWIDVMNVRKLMKDKGLRKSGGCSWVEVRNQVCSFYSEDTHSAELHRVLELLRSEMLVRQKYKNECLTF
ncbi:putative Pentatricopeptide repeat-containing protein [Melia azedarach]|uniref:Pentatricopeptide repeat-containing protein n=2 Tax=Melia azedarach TaxID=155640 RepID=A0ACC1Z1D1_MELAZ|nr:putative Pentatricopeptide repeat-containing protein [Melia azedarach]KAJ4729269.1 putative Pentatricopeptide repeat-containing protein [Melia azedarach]